MGYTLFYIWAAVIVIPMSVYKLVCVSLCLLDEPIFFLFGSRLQSLNNFVDFDPNSSSLGVTQNILVQHMLCRCCGRMGSGRRDFGEVHVVSNII